MPETKRERTLREFLEAQARNAAAKACYDAAEATLLWANERLSDTRAAVAIAWSTYENSR